SNAKPVTTFADRALGRSIVTKSGDGNYRPMKLAGVVHVYKKRREELAMIDPKTEGRIQRLLDQSEIFDLVRIERFYRDQRDWRGLIGSYIKNAPVRTTWFDGTIEGFAEASRRKMEEQGSNAKHCTFPTMLTTVDKRATVESPAMIFDRITFDDVQFDVFQYCSFSSPIAH